MEVSTDNSLHKMLQQQSEESDNSTNSYYFPFWGQQNYEFWNFTNISNTTTNNDSVSSHNEDETIKRMYQVVVPTLLTFCIISIAINIRILIAIYWIRKPLSPTLHISLSLAGADAYTSLVFGTGLVVNSLLPIGFDIQFQNICFALFLETQRLAGIIVTVAHLLTLACNHYLGILRPLHYLSIMTHRNTTICIILLWVLPITFFLIYFSSIEGQGFQSEYCQNYEFMKQLKFRSMFSTMFFVPLALMIVIYFHIFSIVREHQVNRLRLSQINHSSRHHSSNGKSTTTSNHQQMVRNVKAIYTTLLILGSFIIGWMPAVLSNLLFCNDCIFQLNSFNKYAMFFFHCVVNLLIIVKTLLNPIIYAARMHEIKMAIPRMQASLCHWCCFIMADADSESSERSQHSHHRLSQYYAQNSNHLLRNSTTIYRMHSCPGSASNGNLQMHELLQRRSTRGHYHRRRDDYSTEL